MEPLERKYFRSTRSRLLQRAVGQVLEIGCGTGVNFPLYRGVTVTAIEPNPDFREIAARRAEEAAVPIRVMEGSAEQLPFPDEHFDVVVGTLVFCTIPDPARALDEIIRVCKPGGNLLLFEHVLHSNRFLGALQHVLTPAWKRLCDGCHLNRDTERLLREAGLEIKIREFSMNRIFVTLEAQKGSANSHI